MQPQQVAQPTPQAITPTKEKNKSLPIILLLAVLALGSVGFGIYGIFCNKPTETKDLVVKVENEDGSTTTLETDKITISEEDKTITIADSNKKTPSPLSNEEIKNLLTKYGLQQGETHDYRNFRDNLDNFDEYVRISTAIHNYINKKGEANLENYKQIQNSPNWTFTVKYDDLNNEYRDLFGKAASLRKTDYSRNETFATYGAMVVNVKYNDNDEYEIEMPDGLGGWTPYSVIYKVISSEKTDTGIKATLIAIDINTETQSIANWDDEINKLENLITSYTLYFTEENNQYYLTEANKNK